MLAFLLYSLFWSKNSYSGSTFETETDMRMRRYRTVQNRSRDNLTCNRRHMMFWQIDVEEFSVG